MFLSSTMPFESSISACEALWTVLNPDLDFCLYEPSEAVYEIRYSHPLSLFLKYAIDLPFFFYKMGIEKRPAAKQALTVHSLALRSNFGRLQVWGFFYFLKINL